MTLEEFRADLLASTRSRAEAHALGSREAFVSEMSERLREAGEMPDMEACPESLTGKSGGRLELDAFAFDEADESLHLVSAVMDGGVEINTIALTEARTISFDRLERIFEQARSGWLTANIEESRPLWSLARQIERRPLPAALRLHLLTDRRISTTLRSIRSGKTSEGLPIDYQIWDVSRLQRIHEAQNARDDLVIDLSGLPEGGLPVLSAAVSGVDYEAYLAVIPGRALADIYILHGSRLLEGNVRTFLGRSGNINKGIASTLSKEPSRFFAYNNGLAATASAVTLATSESGGRIVTEITDFQIVNGAQTTASLAALRREDKLPEAGVYVPMKLSVVAPEVAEELVPRISKFSNSQNAVRASDFFANHPFHRRIEQISRRVLAPAQSGSQVQTHWYYERARGQYLNDQAGFTSARKAQFALSNPRTHVITKTDLAKVETCFDGLPETACKGAEKAFVAFAERISKAWQDESSRATYGDDWFRSAIARVIIFRATERLVSGASWYASGTRAQVVAYSTAKLASMAKDHSEGGQLDFLRIWSRQEAGESVLAQLAIIAEKVMAILLDPPQAGWNVGEWAKQQACRNRVFLTKFEMVDDFDALLIDKAGEQSNKRAQREEQRVTDGLELIQEIIALGGNYWMRLREVARKHRLIASDEDKALAAAVAIPRRVPTEFQAAKIIAVRRRLDDAGLL